MKTKKYSLVTAGMMILAMFSGITTYAEAPTPDAAEPSISKDEAHAGMTETRLIHDGILVADYKRSTNHKIVVNGDRSASKK